MSNPLFNQFGNKNNNILQLISEIQQFQKTFTGDAKSQVEQMMKEGKLSQEQFNALAQQTNQITQFMAMMPKK